MDVLNVSMKDVGTTLEGFGPVDYVVFVCMLLVCALIGVYYGFCTGKVSEVEYLMGGRKMRTLPVALSLIASLMSGITLLGTPTEIYVYGIQYIYILFGVIAMGFIMSYAYLPVFHNLQVTSTYEYLERRFNKHVRLFGSFLFSLALITWLPIVIYVSALAFNHVTGINVHIITPAVCIVCIFYTCVGGLKAVVWTDVVQTVIMFGAILLVVIKGTVDVGGLGVVWERNYNTGRIEAPILSLDPTIRHSLLTLVCGGAFTTLQNAAVNQNMMQRYLSLPSMRAARIALWLFIVGALGFTYICSYSGMVIFATYYDCDPLTTKRAAAKDQLLPLLVMDTLKGMPGVPGLFLAGVFSAALSSMSTGLNSMAAVVLEDFYKTWFNHQASPRQTNIVMKTVVVVMGVMCVGMVYVVEKLGTVLQTALSLWGVTSGASLGLFNMGLFLPWVNCKGALIGGVASLGFMSWVCLGTQAAIAAGEIKFEKKPVSVEGCTYDFVTTAPALINSTMKLHKDDVFPLYQMSYMWYTLLGSIVSMTVALIVSFFTNPIDPASLDPVLLSPVIRRFLPEKEVEKQDVNMALLSANKGEPNGWKDRQTDRHDEANSRSLQFCDSA